MRTVCLENDGSRGPQTPADVLAVVAEKFGTPVAVLRRRGRHGNVAREVALLLCRELLSVSAAEIASVFDVAASGLSMTVRRAHERMESDAEFARTVMELREQLGR